MLARSADKAASSRPRWHEHGGEPSTSAYGTKRTFLIVASRSAFYP